MRRCDPDVVIGTRHATAGTDRSLVLGSGNEDLDPIRLVLPMEVTGTSSWASAGRASISTEGLSDHRQRETTVAHPVPGIANCSFLPAIVTVAVLAAPEL